MLLFAVDQAVVYFRVDSTQVSYELKRPALQLPVLGKETEVLIEHSLRTLHAIIITIKFKSGMASHTFIT